MGLQHFKQHGFDYDGIRITIDDLFNTICESIVDNYDEEYFLDICIQPITSSDALEWTHVDSYKQMRNCHYEVKANRKTQKIISSPDPGIEESCYFPWQREENTIYVVVIYKTFPFISISITTDNLCHSSEILNTILARIYITFFNEFVLDAYRVRYSWHLISAPEYSTDIHSFVSKTLEQKKCYTANIYPNYPAEHVKIWATTSNDYGEKGYGDGITSIKNGGLIS